MTCAFKRGWKISVDTHMRQFSWWWESYWIITKGKNNWSEMYNIERVPWLNHLPTSERNLKASQLLLQTVQWISRRPIHFYCLRNRMESFWKCRQKLRKPIFWQFSAINRWEEIAHSRNLHENSGRYTLLKQFLHFCDMHNLRHAERARL